MNNVTLIGNISTDLFPRETANGTKTIWFKLAVDREGKDAGADFVPVKAWNGTATACENWLTKGDRVAITGRISTSRKDNEDGSFVDFFEVSARRVEFLTTKKGGNGEGVEETADAGPPPAAASTQVAEPEGSAAPEATPVAEDDIPF